MDTASSLIGLGLLLVFIAPILLLIFKQNKKEKNRLNILNTISEDLDLKPNIKEILDNMLLGLDSQAGKLLVIKPSSPREYRILELSEIREGRLITRNNSAVKNGYSHVSLDLFGPKNRKLSEIVFYDEDDNDSADAEASIVMAKKWENIISSQLK